MNSVTVAKVSRIRDEVAAARNITAFLSVRNVDNGLMARVTSAGMPSHRKNPPIRPP